MTRPKFSDLSEVQQKSFGNGVGAYWMPAPWRKAITETASWFFDEASWRHHDFGYVVGGDRWDRARCDWKFFEAMQRDAIGWTGPWAGLLIPVAMILSVTFYLAVRIGGQFGSFKYRDRYATLEEVLASVESA